jgi:hypothetical protein
VPAAKQRSGPSPTTNTTALAKTNEPNNSAAPGWSRQIPRVTESVIASIATTTAVLVAAPTQINPQTKPQENADWPHRKRDAPKAAITSAATPEPAAYSHTQRSLAPGTDEVTLTATSTGTVTPHTSPVRTEKAKRCRPLTVAFVLQQARIVLNWIGLAPTMSSTDSLTPCAASSDRQVV